MSNVRSGSTVFTASAELAKQYPKLFKTGGSYLVQRVDTVTIADNTANTKAKATVKAKASEKTKKVEKKQKAKPAAKKENAKVTKKASTKAAKAPKVEKSATKTDKKVIKPDIIIEFVRNHNGCNMADIEGATKMPQAAIRRVLNTARESGEIRTEGQRRGLRYFAEKQAAAAAVNSMVVTSDDVDDDDNDGDGPW